MLPVAARISRKEVSRKMFFHMKYSELNVVVVICVLVMEMKASQQVMNGSLLNTTVWYLQPKECSDGDDDDNSLSVHYLHEKRVGT